MRDFYRGCVCVFLLSCLGNLSELGAQVKQGLKLWEQKQYDEARKAFELEVESVKNGVEAAYHLAHLYADTLYADYSYAQSLHYIQKAQAAFLKTSPKQKTALEKKGIGKLAMDKWIDKITRRAYNQATRSKDIEMMDNFLARFNASASNIEKRDGQHLRNTWAYERADKEDSWLYYQTTYKKYGTSMRKVSPALDSTFQDRLFRTYTRDNGWSSIGDFSALYPDNPYILDTLGMVKFGLALNKNTTQGYRQFLRSLDKSPYRGLAIDSLNAQAIRSQDIEQLDYLVRNKLHSPRQAVLLWRTLRAAIKDDDKFTQMYPDAPSSID